MFKKLLLLFFILITTPSYTVSPLVKKEMTKAFDLVFKNFEIIFDESADILLDILLTNPKAYILAESLEKICYMADSLSKQDAGKFVRSLNEFSDKIERKIKNVKKNNKWQCLVKKYGKFSKIREYLASTRMGSY